jgi:hypothetical protein
MAVLVTAAVLAGVLLAGCGGSSGDGATTARTVPAGPRMLDTKKVARAIAESIRTQRDTVATVTCPVAVRQAKGVDFVCTAESKFGRTAFAVVQRDDAGHVTYAAGPTSK